MKGSALLNGQTQSRAQGQSKHNQIIMFSQSMEQSRITRTWHSRLLQCQESVEVWQRILKLRVLAIRPETSVDLISKFARLCQKSGRGLLARRCFMYCLGTDEGDIDNLMQPLATHQDCSNHYSEEMRSTDIASIPNPSVMYALLKHIWLSGEHDRAITLMRRLIRHLTLAVNSDASVANRLARCHYRMACWLRHKHENQYNSNSADDIRSSILKLSRDHLERPFWITILLQYHMISNGTRHGMDWHLQIKP